MLKLTLALSGALLLQPHTGWPAPASSRLPETVLPSIGCWFWGTAEFETGGIRPFLDLAGRHSEFNLLTTSLRVPDREVTEPAVQERIQEAARYARTWDLRLVMDLDVRLARKAFQQAHPDELQEMLRLKEVDLPESGEVVVRIPAETLGDHYTFSTTPYVPLKARLVRVYSYQRGPGAITAQSVQDITAAHCRIVEMATNQLAVAINCGPATAGKRACVMAAFTHFTPDVFAPHLMEFQRQILQQYAGAGLAGACKDEWGFPPCFDGCPAKNDYWFSRFYAEAYARRTGGRDLVRDCLLMYLGEQGRERKRQAAINDYQELAWRRNAALENDFYQGTKAALGSNAVVATHPTWWPYPDLREFKKNGLDWWAARRDWAQTDEVTPFPVRTALAKKWGSAVWYNMFYSGKVADYEQSIWTHALGGGRINFHPVYPSPKHMATGSMGPLLQGPLMRGQARIRLLNFITQSPLDCPVAVIFGHACAMNWAGPAYNDVGLRLTDALWQQGYPADLIPADEIQSGALRLSPEGWVQYGAQRYAAAVLFHPEFELEQTAAFFRQAAGGKTALWRVGDWTRGPDAKPLEPRLPEQVITCPEPAVCARQVLEKLRAAAIAPQTPATEFTGWDQRAASPPTRGLCRLIDGTVIAVSGASNPAGDVIETNLVIRQWTVAAKATGLLAVRLDPQGKLEGLAAGGLKYLRTEATVISLDTPIDLALWREPSGQVRGVLQDWVGPIPPSLANLTTNWLRLALPQKLSAD